MKMPPKGPKRRRVRGQAQGQDQERLDSSLHKAQQEQIPIGSVATSETMKMPSRQIQTQGPDLCSAVPDLSKAQLEQITQSVMHLVEERLPQVPIGQEEDVECSAHDGGQGGDQGGTHADQQDIQNSPAEGESIGGMNLNQVAMHVQSQPSQGQFFVEFRKANAPTYNGGDPALADEWIIQMDKIFSALETPPQFRVTFAVVQLQDEADRWWKVMKSQIPQPMTWDQFFISFQERFCPQVFKEEQRFEFFNLQQGAMTVTAYHDRVMNLLPYAMTSVATEEDRKLRFMEGLRPDIRTRVAIFKLDTIAEVLDKALLVEGELKGLSSAGAVAAIQQRKPDPKFKPKRTRSRRHREERSCTQIEVAQTNIAEIAGKGCRVCGNVGHYKKNCPFKTKTNIDKMGVWSVANLTKQHQQSLNSLGGLPIHDEQMPASAVEDAEGVQLVTDIAEQKQPSLDSQEPKPTQDASESVRLCYHCGKAGHIKRLCPVKLKITTDTEGVQLVTDLTEHRQPSLDSQEALSHGGFVQGSENFQCQQPKPTKDASGSSASLLDGQACDLATRDKQMSESVVEESTKLCYKCGKVGHLRRNCPVELKIKTDMEGVQSVPLNSQGALFIHNEKMPAFVVEELNMGKKQNLIFQNNNQKNGELGGVIFMCNADTRFDCYHYMVMGFPDSRKELVMRIKPDLKLFLYDYHLKVLHGIYKAASVGGIRLEPGAFNGSFPAQVRFKVDKECSPLPFSALRPFWETSDPRKSILKCELSVEQVEKLTSMFILNAVDPRTPALYPNTQITDNLIVSRRPTASGEILPHQHRGMLSNIRQTVQVNSQFPVDLPISRHQFSEDRRYLLTQVPGNTVSMINEGPFLTNYQMPGLHPQWPSQEHMLPPSRYPPTVALGSGYQRPDPTHLPRGFTPLSGRADLYLENVVRPMESNEAQPQLPFSYNREAEYQDHIAKKARIDNLNAHSIHAANAPSYDKIQHERGHSSVTDPLPVSSRYTFDGPPVKYR